MDRTAGGEDHIRNRIEPLSQAEAKRRGLSLTGEDPLSTVMTRFEISIPIASDAERLKSCRKPLRELMVRTIITNHFYWPGGRETGRCKSGMKCTGSAEPILRG